MKHASNDPSRRRRPLAPMLAAMLTASAAWCQLGTGEPVRIEVGAHLQRVLFLTPSTPSISGALPVDAADAITFHFGAASQSLEIDITEPGGQVFRIGDPDTANVKSVITPDPVLEPGNSGANYIMEITNPVPGAWTYEISETVALTGDRAVLLSLISSSPVRAGLFGGGEDYRVGEEIRLGAFAIEGGDVLTDVAIAGTLTHTEDDSFPPAPVAFLDDGAGGDDAAGDGLFTGALSPPPGSYKVSALFSGETSQGQPFERTAAAVFTVEPLRAELSGLFADRGIDDNGDGSLDHIGVAINVEILAAGRYSVLVTLEGSNGNELAGNVTADLPTGFADPEVLFPAAEIRNQIGVDGPYNVSRAVVEFLDTSPNALADAAVDLGQTAAYDLGQLARDPILLLAGGTAVGVDTDGNGKFDFLDVFLPVDMLSSAFYRWSARLVGTDGVEIGIGSSSAFLVAGGSTLRLRFDGRAIGENGLDSPYFVRSLIIFGSGESLIASNAFTVEGFRATDFEGSDSTPPVLAVTLAPSLLWPPNHNLVVIDATIEVSDDTDPEPRVELVAILSSEEDDAMGDGSTTEDIQDAELGTDDRQFRLRAERSGLGDGRVYTVIYRATDAAGNSVDVSSTVVVPKSMGN